MTIARHGATSSKCRKQTQTEGAPTGMPLQEPKDEGLLLPGDSEMLCKWVAREDTLGG